jgi:hypothetical protein
MNVEVTFINGAKAENIFWQLSEAVAVEASAKLKGVLLAKTSVEYKSGSKLNGRILAQTHCALLGEGATIIEE